ncbi:hypothetical protein [Leisingera daeponensis]|nr:hypothetical protein [Leisingera daeponensis]
MKQAECCGPWHPLHCHPAASQDSGSGLVKAGCGRVAEPVLG